MISTPALKSQPGHSILELYKALYKSCTPNRGTCRLPKGENCSWEGQNSLTYYKSLGLL